MTGGIVSPVLPEIVQQLQLDPRWAGTLVSAHALAIALFTPILGLLADRVGKRRVLIVSLLCYSVFGAAGGFMAQLGPLLISRVLLGIASAGIAAASIGLLSTMYDGEARTRMLGYATSAMTTASIFVPVVGGWVGAIHWSFAFYLYGFGVPVALLATIILREGSYRSSSLIASPKELLRVIRQPAVLRLYLSITLAAAVVYAVVIYTPLYLKDAIGADPALNGFVLAIRAVGAATMSAIAASRLAKAIGTGPTVGLGFVIMGAMLCTIPLLDRLWTIVPAAVLFGMGFGITIPNIYDGLAALAPPEIRASVLAIGTGTNSLGQFLSPLLLGPVWETASLPTVFYAAGILAIGVGIISWAVPLAAPVPSGSK